MLYGNDPEQVSRGERMVSININEATIRTATVGIKALTVSGRQVTLALFRQLKRESLVEFPSCACRGMPWGTVNYHTAQCMSRTHEHVVWQLGEELRQDAVPFDENAPYLKRYDDSYRAVARLRVLFWALGGGKVTETSRGYYDAPLWHANGWDVPGTTTRINFSEIAHGLDEHNKHRDWYKSAVQEARRELDAQLQLIPTTWRDTVCLSDDAAREVYATIAEQQQTLTRAWAERWQAIKELPQLFIAV